MISQINSFLQGKPNKPILLDGKALSQKLRQQLTLEIQADPKTHTTPPHLVAILVGDDQASKVYINQKDKACQEVGIKFTLIHLPSDASTDDVATQIKLTNDNPTIHGMIVQLPLPPQINEEYIISLVSPLKDVDCFTATNIGNLVLDKPTLLPATPYGIKLLLDEYKIPTEGKHVVILGKSLIVGQPLMNLLSLESSSRATVTCCDKYTENIHHFTQNADILIVATGKHHIINSPTQIKPNATVIDVGIHRIDDPTRKRGYRLEGDVNFEVVKDHCEYITPVPGGVGPMTVITLLLNVWTAYQTQTRSNDKN